MSRKLCLVVPDTCYEEMYSAMMDRWEATDEKIASSLLSRILLMGNK